MDQYLRVGIRKRRLLSRVSTVNSCREFGNLAHYAL